MAVRDDLDPVITATPWKWHAAVAVAAMQAKKCAATEVPAAITVEECWKPVDTSEVPDLDIPVPQGDELRMNASRFVWSVPWPVLGSQLVLPVQADEGRTMDLLRLKDDLGEYQ